jgi:c-di-GMP-binding flagellar brake protein YcgR
MLNAPQEKRRHLRVDYKIPVKISGEHGDILTETKNLSCSGAFCRMSQRLEPMTKLKVYLLLPLRKSDKVTTKKIICQGVVVRTQAASGEDYYDTAIFFSDIAPKDSRTINEFVESLMENKDGKYN